MDHRAGEEHCGEVTALLTQLGKGNQGAAHKLIPLVYKELHRSAEAFIKLVQHHSIDWPSQAHFFGIAAQVMRRLFIGSEAEGSAVSRPNYPLFVHREETSCHRQVKGGMTR
jgi:hypothetical protein